VAPPHRPTPENFATQQTCPRCKGQRWLPRDTTRETDESGTYTVRGVLCFVCDGAGFAEPYQTMAWLWMTGHRS